MTLLMSWQCYPLTKFMSYRACINDYSYQHGEGIQQLKHRINVAYDKKKK